MKGAFLFFSCLLTLSVAALRYWPRLFQKTAAPMALVPSSLKQAKGATDMAALRTRLHNKATAVRSYARSHRSSDRIAFLADMSMHSGRARFFIYDLEKDSVLAAGLVAHGNCNMGFLADASFGKEPECGCSSEGRYRVGASYPGRFGTAWKLHGLDSSNNTAYERYVVLHAYDCVPDQPIYPEHLCNSLGCPMVSYKFLDICASYIRREKKPVLLWIYR
jgi:hypothetical protein